jgi:hypothetical protein
MKIFLDLLGNIREVLKILKVVIGFLEFFEDETKLENAPHRFEGAHFEKLVTMGVKDIERLLGIAFGEIGRSAVAKTRWRKVAFGEGKKKIVFFLLKKGFVVVHGVILAN